MPAEVWSRGERQVCAMVHPPTRAAEDARRLGREREALLAERIRHANRIKGLLATQGGSSKGSVGAADGMLLEGCSALSRRYGTGEHG